MTERLRTLDRCPAKRQRLTLREIAPGEAEVKVLCLSDRPVWVPTHWDERQRRSVPCPAGCLCGRTLARGFVHVADPWAKEWITAVGEEAGQRINAWLDEHGTLRLTRWILFRTGKNYRCPVRLVIEKPTRVEGVLPPDVDVAAFVRRLYGLPEEALRPPKKMAAGEERREAAREDAWRVVG